MKEDVNLFTDAESANFGDGIVGCSSLDYIPFDAVRDAVPNQAPDICTEVVVTSIDSPVLQNGLGGPIQKINAGDGRLVFCAGLIRDDLRKTGHYQFIIKDSDEVQQEHNNSDSDPSRGE